MPGERLRCVGGPLNGQLTTLPEGHGGITVQGVRYGRRVVLLDDRPAPVLVATQLNNDEIERLLSIIALHNLDARDT